MNSKSFARLASHKSLLKGVVFIIVLSWLIYGAIFYDLQDWDIGVSLVMALSTYFAAARPGKISNSPVWGIGSYQ